MVTTAIEKVAPQAQNNLSAAGAKNLHIRLVTLSSLIWRKQYNLADSPSYVPFQKGIRLTF